MRTLDDQRDLMGQQEPQRLEAAKHVHTAEIVNAVTHGIGLVLSVVGGIVLIARVRALEDIWRTTGCVVFAASLVAVYAASTLSHCPWSPRLRRLFRILDQALIYVLIAGTYTPFALTYLRSGSWWLLFGLMWAVALSGFISKILFSHRVDAIAIWSYLLLGWMPIMGTRNLTEVVPARALWWMLAGGLCYTIGTVFLVYDIKRFHFHAIWHLFVIAGSACHFFTILVFVAGVPGH